MKRKEEKTKDKKKIIIVQQGLPSILHSSPQAGTSNPHLTQIHSFHDRFGIPKREQDPCSVPLHVTQDQPPSASQTARESMSSLHNHDAPCLPV
ncbi:hypothetical protein EYC84_003548 [Monilinia fructicola]|uniref:Uncharacterized protein n=1 Tax=Monilinia fructicola TaxID=38448 RepID=A0A5M9JTZ7_MONFR|nr:hypothetical protein EYC84_003548 [Monilinia fructicola]